MATGEVTLIPIGREGAGLSDILAELKKPGRDPRASFEPPKFRDDVRTMEDRQLLPTEALRPGTTVRAKLVSYEERADELDSMNRGELEDVALLLETPNFAEWISPAGR